MEVSTRVYHPTKNVPLLDYLAGRFTYRPVEAWRALILDGHVRLNGEVVSLEAVVSAGDRLTTWLPEARQPEAEYSYTIIYEDIWLLGIDKPPNLRVHGRGAFLHANLIHHLRHERQPAHPEASLVNRLDADTSGVVVLARDGDTLRLVQEAFRRKSVRKQYLALVEGVPERPVGIIDQPLGRLKGLEKVYRYGSGPAAEKPREALTRYRLVERFGDGWALLELQPLTGRTHQLRAHLAGLGHPLVGDWLYRLDDAEYLAWCENPDRFPPALLPRQALHCAVTEFVHPHTGGRCRMEAPLAADMAALMERLRA